MALTLEITLPFGRYHATPWGRHVNEGQVEWPPSPWRIVRALVSAWHTRSPDLPEAGVRTALEALCSPPEYLLPRWCLSHTRHWMPDRDGSVSLALDPFVATAPDASALATWDVEVDATSRELLDRLARQVPYLGRAESVVSLQFLDRSPGTDQRQRWTPGASGSLQRQALRLLVPDTPLDLEAIHARTAVLQRRGRTTPPSTRWVTYVPPPTTTRRDFVDRPSQPRPQVIQFAVTGRGRPLLRHATLVAAQLRALVTSRVPDEPSLHGHDGKAKRLDQHRHAHYLVLNDLGTGHRIDRVLIWVPEGVPAVAAAEIASLTDVRFDAGDGYLAKRLGTDGLQLGLELVGDRSVLDPAMIGPSKIWQTLTPVTTTRHRKANRESPTQFFQNIVRRALHFRGLPSAADAVDVQVDIEGRYPSNLRARSFHRSRAFAQLQGHDHTGCHVELRFNEPVEGPLILGSLSHFGLGLFLSNEL